MLESGNVVLVEVVVREPSGRDSIGRDLVIGTV
jgi:hypothetical protein